MQDRLPCIQITPICCSAQPLTLILDHQFCHLLHHHHHHLHHHHFVATRTTDHLTGFCSGHQISLFSIQSPLLDWTPLLQVITSPCFVEEAFSVIHLRKSPPSRQKACFCEIGGCSLWLPSHCYIELTCFSFQSWERTRTLLISSSNVCVCAFSFSCSCNYS